MTTQPTPPLPWISNIMLKMRECVCRLLADEGAGPLCWCGIYPGSDVSWEYCGQCSRGTCGMGFVQLLGAYPSSTFPNQQEEATCRAPLAFQLTVGSMRCLPVAEEDGSLPSEGDLLAPALAVNDDMLALLRAVDCCMKGNGLHDVGEYQTIGPQGGCVGGAWTVTVGA